MGCAKELDFAPPPSTDAHLSYYWTMDEAGDLDKVDSTSAHVWDTATGTSSPLGLFVNGVQLDCVLSFVAPFFHGIQNFDDVGFAFDATTSKGISVWFWAKQVDNSLGSISNPSIEWFLRINDPAFTVDAAMAVRWAFVSPPAAFQAVVEHHDYTLGNDYSTSFAFSPALGAWHMLAATLDLVNHTLNAYVDGVLVATSADVGNVYTAPQGTMLLRYDFGGGVNNGNVVIDEFGLSLKGVLTQAQITALYNGGAGVTWPGVNAIVPFP